MDTYEQKYRDALKKAEAFYYSATTEPITEREVLANIFPELKESGDEKIRKNIIIALKSQKDELGGFYKSHNTSESELVDWIEKQGEQKLVFAWSEKDKKYLRRAINATRNGYPETNNWLKSLKERVQPKQEWNEEDERMLNDILMCGEHHCYLDAGNIDWLKSLKERYAWKPSDEQMEAMQKALFDLCGKDEHNIITGLYYDLKKLKENKYE